MQVRLHVKFWLERDGKVLFGEGRQQLLEAVANTGSLAGAARELGMSYRAAWGRIKASEQRLGIKLVEPEKDGHRGMKLTPQARRLMERFQRLQAKIERLCHEEADEDWLRELE